MYYDWVNGFLVHKDHTQGSSHNGLCPTISSHSDTLAEVFLDYQIRDFIHHPARDQLVCFHGKTVLSNSLTAGHLLESDSGLSYSVNLYPEHLLK